MKVLFLTHWLPYAPNRGDRIRSYHLLRAISVVAEIHLVSLADASEQSHIQELPSWLGSVTTAQPGRLRNYLKGLTSLGGPRPLTHALLEAPGLRERIETLVARVQPDLVFAYCTGLAPLALEPPLARLPCVLDMVDVDSEKWLALARRARFPMRQVYYREARTLRPFEAVATKHAITTLVVNERERQSLRSIAPAEPIEVVENGIDLDYFGNRSEPSESSTIVFCGVMNYAPNVEGIEWFVNSVWPRILAAEPAAKLVVVGAHPVNAIRRLTRLKGIEVTGSVSDVRPYLWGGAVAIAPLLTSRGLQNKVLEALAAGLPVVTTEAVSAGLPAEVRPGCLVSDSAETFGDHVLALLRLSPAARRAVTGTAQLSRLRWEARFDRIPRILTSALTATTDS